MLSKSSDAAIHVKNIPILMIDFYKCFYGLSASIIKEALTKNS